jgi:hypothetical protein
LLDHVDLPERLILEHPLKSEPLEVNVLVAVVDDQLLDGLADGTGVLQTVAAGAVGKY